MLVMLKCKYFVEASLDICYILNIYLIYIIYISHIYCVYKVYENIWQYIWQYIAIYKEKDIGAKKN